MFGNRVFSGQLEFNFQSSKALLLQNANGGDLCIKKRWRYSDSISSETEDKRIIHKINIVIDQHMSVDGDIVLIISLQQHLSNATRGHFCHNYDKTGRIYEKKNN